MANRLQPFSEALPVWQTKTRIGIITALPKEHAAVTAMLENTQEHEVPGQGAGRQYLLGELPGANGSRHHVVLALASMGNNMSATRTTQLLNHFLYVDCILIIGIAGGIPHVEKPAEHVRLGDVVVSNHLGVVQYDFNKEEYDFSREKPIITPRYSPRPPSAELLEAALLLEAAGLRGQRSWLQHIPRANHLVDVARPPDDTDQLLDSNDPRKVVAHPADPHRSMGEPRIFLGPIASANKLLKNPKLRDELRDQFGVKAVEMESSGIADATWQRGIGYLAVRGICDYCDSNKNDLWQGYATVVAAAYARSLLETRAGFGSPSEEPVTKQEANKKKGVQSKSKRKQRPNQELMYRLDLSGDPEKTREVLKDWRFVSTAAQPTIAVSQGIIGIGNNDGTTFNVAPVEPVANCRVECELRIIDDGGDQSRWAGIRLRGFFDHIGLGYLVYMRRSGTVELYRAGEVIAGENDVIVPETRETWTHIRVDIFNSQIWVFVEGRKHLYKIDKKFCDKDYVFLHTFGTHAQFRNFSVYKLLRKPEQ